MTRVAWFRLLLGLVLGLIFGLYYAWFVSPRQIHQSTPQDLSPSFQDEYRTLVASAFASTEDLTRALSRLELIEDPQRPSSLNQLAQLHLADGRSEVEVRALAQLASAITTGRDQVDLPQSQTLSPTETDIRTTAGAPTETPSPTPTPTPRPLFILQSIEKVCDLNLVAPLIQVEVEDARGRGIPGVEVAIIWDQGEDHFFTGLKPELGLGYGDFTMDVQVTYTLHLENTPDPITNLQSEQCELAEGGTFPASIRLRFGQP